MKATYFMGHETFEVRECPIPKAKPGTVVVKNYACGVCGTDVHIYHGEKGSAAVNPPVVQLARLAGAAKVVLSEPNEARRKVAKELGADLCINPLEDGYYEKFLAFVGGDGADVIIECAGNHAAVESAFKFARRGATILLFSVPKVEATYEVPLFDVYQKELTIKGTFVNPDTHLRAVELINSGRIQIAPIITHTFTLDELPEAIAMQMSAEAIKVIVKA